jgi:hypothetical protein
MTVAGEMLEGRKDLIEQLHKALHIKIRTKFVPGVDYRNIVAQERRAGEREEPNYNPIDLSDLSHVDAELDEIINDEPTKKTKKKVKKPILPPDDDDDDDDADRDCDGDGGACF